MKGWFDAFRDNGGPTLYSFANRTSVTGDVTIVAVSVLFTTLYLAFLVIFPGVRKQRFTTFVTVTLSLFVGLVILVTRFGSAWHVANTTIVAPYRAFSREKLPAHLGAHIGLVHVNITLAAIPIGNQSVPDIDFNERFFWDKAHDMGNCYRHALQRGLPFPILTVAEYFSLGQEGFAWGGEYRAAGYYATITLWASFASWMLMNLLLIAVPRYGAYTKCVTGALLVLTAVGYYMLLPQRPLTIVLEGGRLEFRLGWCFWLVLIAGILCLCTGMLIAAVDLVWPHRFSTILEVYYDTPYDRHVILEESHDVRYRKRNNSKGLEEPPGLGSRILRRLSSKTKDQAGFATAVAAATAGGGTTPGTSAGTTTTDGATTHTATGGGGGVGGGDVNQHRSLSRPVVPNSPWRYPFRRTPIVAPGGGQLHRTMSQDSTSSMASSIAAAGMSTSPSGLPPNGAMAHKVALSRLLPKPPVDHRY